MRNNTTLKTIAFIALFFNGYIPINAQGFSDETIAAGIVADHDGDDYGELIAFGSGGAWLDVNSDGFLDCYITMRTQANKLYVNNGDGTFTESAAAYGLEDATGDGAGVAVADFDNDGFQDIYLANGGTDRLFKNMNGSFTDITAAAGFDITDDSRGTSASWADYDNDGYLDLYVAHHNHKQGAVNSSTSDRLYHNNGDQTFTEVSSLLSATGTITGHGFIGSWTDINNDGFIDLILINDCQVTNPIPNQVFLNNGGTDGVSDWTFTEIGTMIGADHCENAMGIAVGDPNHDGWMDFYFSNIGEAFFLQNSNGSFTDATATTNTGGQVTPMFSWGTSFLDYDLDGWQDLLITLGSYRFPYTTDPHPDMLFHNTGTGTFTDVSAAMNMNEPARGRHSLCADYDNDGDPDVLILMYNEAAKLKRNNNNNGNNYIKFNLVGTVSNRDGIGAKLKLTTSDMTQYFETRSGSNLGGGEPTGAYFGIGTNTSIDELEITWPSGIVNVYQNLSPNQTVTLTENASSLPVEWLDFSLNVRDKHTVVLAWSTSAEFESHGFEIQRSTNGLLYENVGWETSINKGNQIANYTFADETVAPGNQYYYRIKQFDFDGKFSYSKILSAKIDAADFIIVKDFHPNPSHGSANIEVILPDAMQMDIAIFQMNGQQITNYSQNLDKGIQKIQLSNQELESGVYFVKILLQNEIFIRKIIIKK